MRISPFLAAPLAVVLAAACSRSTSTTTTTASTGVAPKIAANVRAATAPALPTGVTPQMIALGDSLYSARSCQRCHGPRGTSGPNGPDLTAGAWLHIGGSYEQLVTLITTGVPRAQLKNPARQFAMNPRGGGTTLLTDDQVKAIAAYVWSISRAKTAS